MNRAAIQSFLRMASRQAQRLWHRGCQFLWPAECSVCASAVKEDQGGFCRECWQDLSAAIGGDYCRGCGKGISVYGMVGNRCGRCLADEIVYDGFCRVGVYEGVLKQMLLGLKFRDKVELFDSLGPIFNQAFTLSGLAEKTDILVPVPLHWRRRFQRGFNQSFILARHLEKEGLRISEDLVRIRYTPHQWQMETDSQRRKNVRGAFAVRKGHHFDGKSVCLVDDITTSGATLKECADTLRQAGATAIYVAVMAVAEGIS